MAEVTMNYAVRDGASAPLVWTAGTAATQEVAGGQDERFCILVHNTGSSASTVTVEAGDGVRASIGPLVATVEANQQVALVLDSARFKKLRGANAGKYVMKSTGGATTKFAPLHL